MRGNRTGKVEKSFVHCVSPTIKLCPRVKVFLDTGKLTREWEVPVLRL